MDILTTKLKAIISEALDCDENSIDEHSGLGRHQEWDSLGQVVIIVSIEKYFSIKIKDEQIERLLTFVDLREYLKKKSINRNLKDKKLN